MSTGQSLIIVYHSSSEQFVNAVPSTSSPTAQGGVQEMVKYNLSLFIITSKSYTQNNTSKNNTSLSVLWCINFKSYLYELF